MTLIVATVLCALLLAVFGAWLRHTMHTGELSGEADRD